MVTEYKTCNICNISKPLSEYPFSNKLKNKLKLQCKKCNTMLSKEWYKKNTDIAKKYREANKEERREYSKQYRKDNKDFISEKNKVRNVLNRDERIKKQRKYKKENKELIKEQSKKYRMENSDSLKEYYRENKERILEQGKQYRAKNKERANNVKKEYNKKRKAEDIGFKLKINLRARLGNAMRYQSVKKTNKTMSLVGCSMDYLKKHLESQFTKGMTWANYGLHGWHIDHIKPCIGFDLTKDLEQKKCFNYKNLQPLWAIDNLKKGARIG